MDFDSRLRVLFALLCVAACFGPSAAAEASSTSWRWRFDQSGGLPNGAVAVARSSAGRLASGGARGVALRGTGETPRRIAMRAPVRDLGFDAGDRLYIATERGLFRLYPGASTPLDISPPGGERARAASRLAVAGAEVAVATDAGVFWRKGGAPWRRIEAAAAGEAPLRALALTVAAARPSRLWIGGERGLFVSEPELDSVAREIPLPQVSGAVVDLFVDRETLWVLSENALVEIGTEARVHALPAAPGADRFRITRTQDGFFLATARGLWLASGATGPWRRASDPAGFAAWPGLVTWPGGAAAAGPRGLLLGEPILAALDAGLAPDIGVSPSAKSCAPDVAAVHRAALDYLHLRGDPVSQMRRGVRRRGWLPTLRFDAGYAVDRGRSRDLDQAYVSGGLRELNDWERDSGRGKDVSVAMTWQLGELLYHPEEIDVSTEARRLIELRDDVLDEINQLYFDREQALRDGSGPLRAARFSAGLDAWTGGWFSRSTQACAGAQSP